MRLSRSGGVRRAVGDGVFRFTLALQVNVQALEFARLEGLRATAAFFWMGSILGGPRAEDLPPDEVTTYERERGDAWAQWRTVVDRLSSDARVESLARAALERRYFGGHDVFFADASQAWADHVDLVERLAGLAEGMASTGKPPTRHGRNGSAVTGSVDALVAARTTRLADDARVRAFELLGDRPKAVAIMERRLLGEVH